jgi:hypothetical protein
MSKTLAQILQETLEGVPPPDSYDAFANSLKRNPGRAPTLPRVQESPENLGSPDVVSTTSMAVRI